MTGGGPETVILSDDGTAYLLCENGDVKSIQVDNTSSPPTTVARVGGRPLGGALARGEGSDAEDILYLAEASKGLLRLTVPKLPVGTRRKAKVELVAFELGDGTPILYADDVAVGNKSGKVYFTDASDVVVERVRGSRTLFDTLSASIVDGVRGERTGKLLAYDPRTGETEVLADGIWFANGVAVSEVRKNLKRLIYTHTQHN